MEVVQMLLGHRNHDTNLVDPNGRLPISWAAQNGHDEVVEQLLENKDVNSDVTNRQ